APSTRPGISTTATMIFNFQDAPVDAILNQLSENFGFIIIKTPGQITGRVTATSRKPLDAGEAISLVNDVLYPLGYATLETKTSGTNARTILRLVTIAEAKKSQIPV